LSSVRKEPVVVRFIGKSAVREISAVSVVTGRKPRPRTARSVGLLVARSAPGWSMSRVVVTRTPPAE
jgi:hypothetical protein